MRYKVLDLFCGSGGLSLGFQLAGYEVVGGIDHDEDSIITYAKNFPKAQAICEDLLKYTDKEIKKYFSRSRIDVIVGGPPCQGFSNANRWQHEAQDSRNKLFYEYLRFVKILRPKAIIIENVRGILSKDGGYAARRITALLSNLGYQICSSTLNAADFGVPQNRYRSFFVGIRSDLNAGDFPFDSVKKRSKVHVQDAIGELYKYEKTRSTDFQIKTAPNSEYRKYLRASNSKIFNHQVVYPAEITQKRISYVPQGGNWQQIPNKLFSTIRSNRHSSAFKRLSENEVSVTIDTGNSHSNYFHPKYNRLPTVREAARLQSFPDSFVFLGSRTSQYRQVGNAVPPLLAKEIALTLKKCLK